MSTTHITPTIGRIVWYRGADGETRAAIVTQVNGDFNVNLFVFGRTPADPEQGPQVSVTHADPEQEPGCLLSWHWMPYQLGQAKKDASKPAPGASLPGYSALLPHQQRVIDEKAELDERVAKLRTFLDTEICRSLDPLEQQRLGRQETAMARYSEILAERIDAFATA